MIVEEDLNQHNFRIQTQKLQLQFQCTICLNPISDCYITRCGHVYCKPCIQQSTNRHHRCPFCNQELKDFKMDVFKNYHFNTLKKLIDQQKMKYNQKYLSKVFQKVNKEDKVGQNMLMEPIQKELVKHCQEALLMYRQYLIELYNSLKETEEKKLLLGMGSIRTNNQLIKQLQTTVLNSLPNPVISPQLISLPTQIEVFLPGKKSYKNTLKLSPISPFTAILPYLQNVCSQMNCRIEGEMPSELIINGDKVALQSKIGILCGKTIKIEGIPIEINVFCFTYGWQKGKNTTFYFCKDCNMKWICQSCILLCHKGHNMNLQLKDHKTQWACCYCATKCKCVALNKNSKIKG